MGENSKRRGLMLVLSSPSGAGKTTLSRLLLEDDPRTVLSVSTTTRPKRPGEVQGRDYNFVDQETFQTMVETGAFLEYATVFGHSYGTPKETVESALAVGMDVLFDIDWQGTQQLDEKARDDLVSIFILPPSMEELHERLVNRAQDSEEVVQKRMAKARDEITHYSEYDYVLVNKDLGTCLNEIKTILAAERLRRSRRVGLSDFVKRLIGDEA